MIGDRAGEVSVSSGADHRRVLLVEDDTLIALLTEENLRALGFEPVSVDTAHGALAALADPYELAVIDVGLPDMRGDELTVRARRLAPGMSVIVASGYDEAEFRLRFRNDAGVAVLGKPYTEADLRGAIVALGLPLA